MSNESIQQVLLGELLCISDSKWVLGHWYIKTMLNGRSVPDFASMAGMAQDELGQTRAIMEYIEQSFDLPEFQLEFGRGADEVHNMGLLDGAPQSWADFVVTVALAEQALWSALEGLVGSKNQAVSNMAKKFGEEGYFHRLYIDGWIAAFDDGERAEAAAALPERLQLARRWFDFASEELNDAGIRTWTAAECREHFEVGVDMLAKAFRTELPEVAALSGEWDGRRRRTRGSAMPPRLWEYVLPTTEAAKLARRPLEESVKDNLDLFVKPKKVDETEPFFER